MPLQDIRLAETPQSLFGVTRCLLIREPWIDLILSGRKRWEIRGAASRILGPVALAKSETGCIFGVVNLTAVHGPLSLDHFRATEDRHQVRNAKALPYRRTFAWQMEDPVLFDAPIPYSHPAGAVIWVRLPGFTQQEIDQALLQHGILPGDLARAA